MSDYEIDGITSVPCPYCGALPGYTCSCREGYYIRCVQGGDLALWWRPNRHGYTVNLDEAGVYSEEEARRLDRGREIDVAYRVEDVNPKVIRALGVDAAYDLPRAFAKKETA